ncbi:MAG: acetyltransferase [Mariprofundaceae bacterium]
MFLKDSSNGDLVEVLEVRTLTDPTAVETSVRYQAGEEAGDPVGVRKMALTFPSGEVLPKCWMDVHYRISF